MYHLRVGGQSETSSSTQWKATYVMAIDTIRRSLNFVIVKGPATGEAVEPAAMAILLSSRVGNERECLLQNIEQGKKKSRKPSRLTSPRCWRRKWWVHNGRIAKAARAHDVVMSPVCVASVKSGAREQDEGRNAARQNGIFLEARGMEKLAVLCQTRRKKT